MSYGIAGRIPPGSQNAVDEGGLSAVVNALRVHAANVTVVRLALAAFTNMFTLKTALTAMVDAGVPELVVAAMNAHAGDSQVQEIACRVLLLFMSDQKDGVPGVGLLAVRATDCVPALNAAITRHSAALDVILTAYHLLQTLGWTLDLGAASGARR